MILLLIIINQYFFFSPTSISVESGSIPATPSPSPHGAPQPDQSAQKPMQEPLI